MKKRILSLALALVMTLTMLPTAALAAPGIEVDENGFAIKENGTLVRYEGPGGDVVVPDGVTAIDTVAFRNHTEITSVVIPDSVTRMSGGAFRECPNLRRVQIGNGVTEIPSYAFDGCTSLEEVVIPDSVTEIGVDSFARCGALARVEIPASVKTIGNAAFAECPALREVVLSEGLTAIGNQAFIRCAALERIEIPAGVTRIGYSTFMSCASLKEAVFPDGLTEIEEGAFESCTSLERVDLPASVEKIGQQAFSHCASLKEVNIANPDADVDRNAFYRSALTSYTQGGRTVTLKSTGTIPDSNDSSTPRTPEEGIAAAQRKWASAGAPNADWAAKANALLRQADELNSDDRVVYETRSSSGDTIVYRVGDYRTVPVQAQRKSDEICAGLTTDYDKVLAIHDFVVNHMTYIKGGKESYGPDLDPSIDLTAYENTNISFETDQTRDLPDELGFGAENNTLYAAMRALKHGTGVCNNYAALFGLLCYAQGIPAMYAGGTAYELHAWNAVKVDGEWRWVDTTWDDQASGIRYDYFLCPTEFISTDHETRYLVSSYVDTKKIMDDIQQMQIDERKERLIQEINEYASPWARSWITTAYEKGLYTDGMKNRFEPDYTKPISRSEFCVLVVKLVEQAEGGDFVNGTKGISAQDYAASKGRTYVGFKTSAFPFQDVKSRTYGSTGSIPLAYSLGIVNGTSETTFSPNGDLTREQAATMLMRAGRLLGLTTGSDPIRFQDNGQIGDWAKEGVDFITSHGIMNGVENNNFDPQGRYTREQALVTIVRMYDAVKK